MSELTPPTAYELTLDETDDQRALRYHVEKIQSDVREYAENGPVAIFTRMPELPGVQYFDALKSNPNQQPFTRIGSSQLILLPDESYSRTVFYVQHPGAAWIEIPPEVIDVVLPDTMRQTAQS